jgi:protoporphyrinogen oxidase
VKIAIIGGGITGLTAAYELSKKNLKVDLYEKSTKIGGLAAVFSLDNSTLEKYYHHIFRSDKEIINLIEEFGLSKDLLWLDSKMGYFIHGKIYPFTTPKDLIFFSPLSIVDRFRFGLSILRLRRRNNWQNLERVTAKEWLKKNVGEKVYDSLWKPLLKNKFGQRYNEISMTWFWRKIKLRGTSRTKSGRKEKLGYLDGGFGKMIDNLGESIQKLGGQIRCGCPIKRLERGGDKILLHGYSNESVIGTYDKVLCTVPLPVFLEMTEGLPLDYKRNKSRIEYTAILCAVLVLKSNLSNVYWLNIGEDRYPFGGIIEHTNLVGNGKYNNKHIVYITNYLYPEESLYKSNKKYILKEYINYLKQIFPQFSEHWIEKYYIFRDRYAQPIITTNYSKIKPDFTTPIKDLYIANMCHIYPEDRGMNYAVETAKLAVNEMLDSK